MIKHNDERADYIENLIIKLGDAGDKDLIDLLDSYEEENKKLKEENEKLKLTLEALDVPENMSYYFREQYKIISARMYKAIKLFQDCGEDWSTLPLDMYEALTGEDLKPKGSEVNENNENN